MADQRNDEIFLHDSLEDFPTVLAKAKAQDEAEAKKKAEEEAVKAEAYAKALADTPAI